MFSRKVDKRASAPGFLTLITGMPEADAMRITWPAIPERELVEAGVSPPSSFQMITNWAGERRLLPNNSRAVLPWLAR